MTASLAITRVIDNEGGYTPGLANDPGGETNWGISKRSYPNLDIHSLIRDQAAEIYRTDFWNRIQGDALPFVLAYQLLDFAVNSGPNVAIKKLQVLVGFTGDDVDGVIGKNTLAAIKSHNPLELTLQLVAERINYLRVLRNFPTFSSGWSARMAKNILFICTDYKTL